MQRDVKLGGHVQLSDRLSDPSSHKNEDKLVLKRLSSIVTYHLHACTRMYKYTQ